MPAAMSALPRYASRPLFHPRHGTACNRSKTGCGPSDHDAGPVSRAAKIGDPHDRRTAVFLIIDLDLCPERE